MTRPVIILDPHWRTMAELFSGADLDRLHAGFDVVWGNDAPIPDEVLAKSLPQAQAIVAATPIITRDVLETAPKLRAVIEVSGAFPGTIDYAACFGRGVEVLSCSPGFREAVAEMGLAMMLAGARGLVREHEAFRVGQEGWLEDRSGQDFTLYRGRVGFIGFGQIAREMTGLLAPFAPEIRAYDPWCPAEVAEDHGAGLCGLDALLEWSRILVVAAVPTRENAGLLDAARLSRLPDRAHLVLISRSHLVNWADLMAELSTGRLSAAIDVFPTEPIAPDDPIRTLPNVILSPHRAAAVEGGRHLIGRMVIDDLKALVAERTERRLARANPGQVASLAGVGDAKTVAAMAGERS